MTCEHSPILDRSPTKGRKTWSSQHFCKTVNSAQPVKKTSNASERAVERVGTDAFVAAKRVATSSRWFTFFVPHPSVHRRARARGARVASGRRTRRAAEHESTDAMRIALPDRCRSMPTMPTTTRTAPHRNASHPRRSIDRSNGLLDP